MNLELKAGTETFDWLTGTADDLAALRDRLANETELDPTERTVIAMREIEGQIKSLKDRLDGYKAEVREQLADGVVVGSDRPGVGKYVLQPRTTHTFDAKAAVLAGVLSQADCDRFTRTTDSAALVYRKAEEGK